MKVIVAGFPKTGTKSMRMALLHLGYSVYDVMEHYEHHGDDWNRIINFGGTTKDFRRMYGNVDAVTDVPAFYFWDEIHKAFPDSKIILTIRESEDIWFKSMLSQMEKTFTTVGMVLMKLSPTGRKFCYFIDNCSEIIFGKGGTSSWTVPRANEMIAKMKYRRHTAAVLQNAPKDKLLVFNVKQGWKPLCNFLDVKIPSIPFPHKNVKGEQMKEFLESQKTFLQIQKEIKIALCLIAVVLAIVCYQIVSIIFY